MSGITKNEVTEEIQPDRPTLPPKPGYVERSGIYFDINTGEPLLPLTLEDFKRYKFAELSETCDNAIFAGISVETTKGLEHFSLTLPDQKNIMALASSAEVTGKPVLYHADEKPCRLFAPEEISNIYSISFAYITYTTTLCNFYNTWVRRAENADEINAITWGLTLPEDLKNEDGLSLNELMDAMGIPFREPTGV